MRSRKAAVLNPPGPSRAYTALLLPSKLSVFDWLTIKCDDINGSVQYFVFPLEHLNAHIPYSLDLGADLSARVKSTAHLRKSGSSAVLFALS